MRKSVTILSVFILTALTTISAQKKTRELIVEAQKHFMFQNPEGAIPLLEEVIEQDTSNVDAYFMLANAYYLSKSGIKKSLPYFKTYFEKAKKPSIDAYFSAAHVYQLTNDFENAKKYYELFLENCKKKDARKAEAKQEIKACDSAKKLMTEKHEYKIHNMGYTINSQYPDYVPVISADESVLFFTSRRPGNVGGLRNIIGEEDTLFGDYFEDILFSIKLSKTKWSDPLPLGTIINTTGHDGSIGLSYDGQKMYFYRSDGKGYGNIYVTELDGSEWKEPVKLPEPINSEYWDGSISTSVDGKTVFIASDRPGGYGGKDLYMIKQLPDGEWAAPKNLGPTINTKFDEDAPFIHPDGNTLYFSSKGHEGMGGYDIFKSTYTGKYEWEKPTNMGYPINTSGNNLYFVLSANGERGYYSSLNDSGMAEDIMVVEMPQKEEFRPKPLTVVRGIIHSDIMEHVPPGVNIEVYDNENHSHVGTFQPNESTGKYLLILPRGKDYNIAITAPKHLFHSENIVVPLEQKKYVEIYKDIFLTGIKQGSKVVLNNVFFDFGKATLRQSSKTELDRVYNYLIENDSIIVEFSGHTDSKGSFQINEAISRERAKVVVDYLAEKGIDRSRMLAKGYAYLNPVAINTFINGTDNERGRDLNRRTEMEIHSTKGEDLSHRDHIVFMDYVPMVREKNYYLNEMKEDTIYKILIGTTSESAQKPPKDFFYGLHDLMVEKSELGDNLYTAGFFYQKENAEDYYTIVENMGYFDPKIAVYIDGNLMYMRKAILGRSRKIRNPYMIKYRKLRKASKKVRDDE